MLLVVNTQIAWRWVDGPVVADASSSRKIVPLRRKERIGSKANRRPQEMKFLFKFKWSPTLPYRRMSWPWWRYRNFFLPFYQSYRHHHCCRRYAIRSFVGNKLWHTHTIQAPAHKRGTPHSHLVSFAASWDTERERERETENPTSVCPNVIIVCCFFSHLLKSNSNSLPVASSFT